MVPSIDQTHASVDHEQFLPCYSAPSFNFVFPAHCRSSRICACVARSPTPLYWWCKSDATGPKSENQMPPQFHEWKSRWMRLPMLCGLRRPGCHHDSIHAAIFEITPCRLVTQINFIFICAFVWPSAPAEYVHLTYVALCCACPTVHNQPYTVCQVSCI